MEDSVVIQELKQGSERALKEIFFRFDRPLLVFVHQLTKNREVAEEIVADIFMKVWDLRQDFESIDKLRSFLYVAGRNACYNYLKKPERKLFVTDVLELSGEFFSQDQDILKNIIKTELLHAIFEKAAKMPAKQRAIFDMIFKENLTVEEICQKLGVKPSAVYANRSRAVQYLKSTLGLSDLTFLSILLFYTF